MVKTNEEWAAELIDRAAIVVTTPLCLDAIVQVIEDIRAEGNHWRSNADNERVRADDAESREARLREELEFVRDYGITCVKELLVQRATAALKETQHGKDVESRYCQS